MQISKAIDGTAHYYANVWRRDSVFVSLILVNAITCSQFSAKDDNACPKRRAALYVYSEWHKDNRWKSPGSCIFNGVDALLSVKQISAVSEFVAVLKLALRFNVDVQAQWRNES